MVGGAGSVTALAKRTAGLPTDYNPEKGLKNLAVAEAAELRNRYAPDRDDAETVAEIENGPDEGQP